MADHSAGAAAAGAPLLAALLPHPYPATGSAALADAPQLPATLGPLLAGGSAPGPFVAAAQRASHRIALSTARRLRAASRRPVLPGCWLHPVLGAALGAALAAAHRATLAALAAAPLAALATNPAAGALTALATNPAAGALTATLLATLAADALAAFATNPAGGALAALATNPVAGALAATHLATLAACLASLAATLLAALAAGALAGLAAGALAGLATLAACLASLAITLLATLAATRLGTLAAASGRSVASVTPAKLVAHLHRARAETAVVMMAALATLAAGALATLAAGALAALATLAAASGRPVTPVTPGELVAHLHHTPAETAVVMVPVMVVMGQHAHELFEGIVEAAHRQAPFLRPEEQAQNVVDGGDKPAVEALALALSLGSRSRWAADEDAQCQQGGQPKQPRARSFLSHGPLPCHCRLQILDCRLEEKHFFKSAICNLQSKSIPFGTPQVTSGRPSRWRGAQVFSSRRPGAVR
ncbi:MAG: hypothetical protein HYS12_17760 [Planctomycetes bacterium]|nr:hypothetical protein [Planctomycetota bacterium]